MYASRGVLELEGAGMMSAEEQLIVYGVGVRVITWDERFGLEEHTLNSRALFEEDEKLTLVRKSLSCKDRHKRITANFGSDDISALGEVKCYQEVVDYFTNLGLDAATLVTHPSTVEYRTLKPRPGDIIEVASRNEMQQGQRPATLVRDASKGCRFTFEWWVWTKINAISNWFRQLTR
jgi:hypothetical protein